MLLLMLFSRAYNHKSCTLLSQSVILVFTNPPSLFQDSQEISFFGGAVYYSSVELLVDRPFSLFVFCDVLTRRRHETTSLY